MIRYSVKTCSALLHRSILKARIRCSVRSAPHREKSWSVRDAHLLWCAIICCMKTKHHDFAKINVNHCYYNFYHSFHYFPIASVMSSSCSHLPLGTPLPFELGSERYFVLHHAAHCLRRLVELVHKLAPCLLHPNNRGSQNKYCKISYIYAHDIDVINIYSYCMTKYYVDDREQIDYISCARYTIGDPRGGGIISILNIRNAFDHKSSK